jgi:quinol monooxygenase YgiN
MRVPGMLIGRGPKVLSLFGIEALGFSNSFFVPPPVSWYPRCRYLRSDKGPPARRLIVRLCRAGDKPFLFSGLARLIATSNKRVEDKRGDEVSMSHGCPSISWCDHIETAIFARTFNGLRGKVTFMHVIIWKFTVRDEHLQAFVSAYGADGDWATLFRRAEGYLGTELLRLSDRPNIFLTIDRWENLRAFEAFKEHFGAEYARLDSQLEAFTSAEERVGVFSPA